MSGLQYPMFGFGCDPQMTAEVDARLAIWGMPVAMLVLERR